MLMLSPHNIRKQFFKRISKLWTFEIGYTSCHIPETPVANCKSFRDRKDIDGVYFEYVQQCFSYTLCFMDNIVFSSVTCL